MKTLSSRLNHYSFKQTNKQTNKKTMTTLRTLDIPIINNLEIIPCWECSYKKLNGQECSADCSCSTREYVSKEHLIKYLRMSDEYRRSTYQVVFGDDLRDAMGYADLQEYKLCNDRELRLFFHMFDDVYPYKENGQINLYQNSEPMNDVQLGDLLITFENDREDYLLCKFNVECNGR